MAFDLLPALRPRAWRSVVCVRVCRKWEYRGGTDDGPIQHVDLVLIDEKGNTMYAEIPASEVEAKSPRIEEGNIYTISRFRVSNAKSGYRPVDAKYMIEFTLHTVISAPRTDMPDFPRCAYKITTIPDLPSHAGDTRNFLDTIGLLVEKSDAYPVHLPNKPAPTLTRHVILRDLSYSEMKVTLWGERAAAFNTDGINEGDQDKPIVVLFVGCLVKSYQGTYYLSANAASRWYFNPPIPEARQFFDSFQNQRIQIRVAPAPVEQQGQLQAAAPLEEKTLRELNLMDPYEFADNGYRCTVTIGRLVPNVSWWFPSCTRCSRSCTPEGNGYRCMPCANTSFKFKYKLCFTALDGTDEAEMICFGDVARRMIGKPVQQLLRSAPAPNTYPPDITKMVSLRFTFQVSLTQQSYYREQKTYQVVSVVTSYGHQNVIAPAPAPAPDTQSGGAQTDQAALAPTNVADHDVPSPTTTPPPALASDDTLATKKYASDAREKTKSSDVKRKLIMDNEGAEADSTEESPTMEALPDASLTDATASAVEKSHVPTKDVAAIKKKQRGASSGAQKCG